MELDFRPKIDHILKKFSGAPEKEEPIKFVNGKYISLIRKHLFLSIIPSPENKRDSVIQKLDEIDV